MLTEYAHLVYSLSACFVVLEPLYAIQPRIEIHLLRSPSSRNMYEPPLCVAAPRTAWLTAPARKPHTADSEKRLEEVDCA